MQNNLTEKELPANVQSMGKKYGVSGKELEKAYKAAITASEDKSGKKEDKFEDKDWKFAIGVLKNILINKSKKKESTITDLQSIIEFIETDIEPDTFIRNSLNETQTSADLADNLGTDYTKKSKKKGKDEEKEDDEKEKSKK